MKDDHLEALAQQQVLGLAATTPDGNVAAIRAERALESIGVRGQNQDPHTARVSPGGRPGLR